MIKVSVIVPVYNSSKYLKKCLDSLTNQTLKDIEIIAVNDGSTDNSLEILNSYKEIKVYSKENGGQATARNFGLTKANGKYISFIDSDDYVDKNFLKEMYDAITKTGSNVVMCDYYKTTKNEKIIFRATDKNEGKISKKEFMLSEVCPWNKLYLKDFLIKNNYKFIEGIIYEDYAATPTLVKYNLNAYYLKKPLIYYVQSDSSTTRNDEYKEKYKDIIKASTSLYNSLVNTEYKEELEYLITFHLLYLGSLNFYKYNKYEYIDEISAFMKEKFPKCYNNKYIKQKLSKKDQILLKLFLNKKYRIIKLIQKLKRCIK